MTELVVPGEVRVEPQNLPEQARHGQKARVKSQDEVAHFVPEQQVRQNRQQIHDRNEQGCHHPVVRVVARNDDVKEVREGEARRKPREDENAEAERSDFPVCRFYTESHGFSPIKYSGKL